MLGGTTLPARLWYQKNGGLYAGESRTAELVGQRIAAAH